jgi:hypothetical protein
MCPQQFLELIYAILILIFYGRYALFGQGIDIFFGKVNIKSSSAQLTNRDIICIYHVKVILGFSNHPEAQLNRHLALAIPGSHLLS